MSWTLIESQICIDPECCNPRHFDKGRLSQYRRQNAKSAQRKTLIYSNARSPERAQWPHRCFLTDD